MKCNNRYKELARQVAIAVGAAGVVSASSLALAQATPAAPSKPADAANSDPKKIETIVVTTQRRAEDLLSVSVSVSAVTGEKLAERNVTDLSQMESLSPGFTFGRSGTDARPAMRGVRTENVGVNGDTTIGYFVDGIYKSRAQQAMASFIDVARVEIQRGPQGTLYGRNTFGGNVAVATNSPVLKDFQGDVSLSVGDYKKFRVEGILNVPLGDTLALRVVGASDRADGWVKNDFNSSASLFDQDLTYGRASLLWKPNSRFEAIFRAETTDQGGNGGSAFGYKQAGTYYDRGSCQQLFNSTPLIMNVRPGNRDGVNDCVRTVGAGAGTGANAVGSGVDLGIPLYAAGNAYRVDTDYKSFLKVKDKSSSLDMSYKFDGFTVKSITGYADFYAKRTSDSDMSASAIAADYQNTAAKTFTQELQILSESSGPLSYVAGYYYFKDELIGTFINQQFPRTIRSSAITTPISLAQNGAGAFDEQKPETESNAVYAQFNYEISKALSVSAGLRSTTDKKKFKFANGNAVLPLTTAGLPDGTQITLNTASPPSSAFGVQGQTNCVGALAVPGFQCGPAGTPANAVLYGATYDDATFKKTTGRAAVEYKLGRKNLLYATYSTGFRSGGFNSGQAAGSLAATRTFSPEEVEAVEVGSKNRFLADTLQINAALFSNRYKNLQEQRQVPFGATTISTIFNAAKAKADGLEIEAEWLATDRLALGSSLSFLDAKYTSFPDVALPFGTSILVTDPSATTATIVDGITIAPVGQRRVFAPGYNCRLIPGQAITTTAPAFGCDLSGKRIPYAAKFQGSAYVTYDIPLAGGARISPTLVATYNSGFYGQPTNAELEKQGAFTKFDFKLNWQVNDRLSFQLSVDNLTDKQTLNRFVWGGGGALQVSAAPPRFWGLKMVYKTF
jgi:iron complex outermembrane receptor protein